MTQRELDEVHWVHTQIAQPMEFPNASDDMVVIGNWQYSEKWIRHYAFCRHKIACMKISSCFANIRSYHQTQSREYYREVTDLAVDLALLLENAKILHRENRKKQEVAA